MNLSEIELAALRDNWQLMQARPPQDLAEARLQTHWAAQAVAAVAEGLATPKTDFSHTNLRWHAEQEMLIGHTIGSDDSRANNKIRVGIGFRNLTLAILDTNDVPLDTFECKGHTVQEAVAHLNQTLPKYLGAALDKPLTLPTYEMPQHVLATGAPFSLASQEAHNELIGWYHNAALILGLYQAKTPKASPVRCWPHHFDIATLTVFDTDKDPEQARSIGFGMTPGDTSYDEPYYYINPWPRPKKTGLPKLAGRGLWHEEGWFGAVLPAHQLLESSTQEQAEQIMAYVDAAFTAHKKAVNLT